MADKQVRRGLPLRPILLLLMGAVLLYLGVGFVRQARISYQRRQELHQVEEAIAAAQEEGAALEERLNYVLSPEAAEEWARENGWARLDEVPVVVVAPPAQPSAGVEAGRTDSPSPRQSREAWWDLFFGER